MRINLKSMSGILIGLGLLAVFSCEEVTEEILNPLEARLIGEWELTDNEVLTEVESSIDQNYFLMYRSGVGNIDISGDISASLNYLFDIEYDGGHLLVVSNQLFFLDDLPSYTLQLTVRSENGKFLSLSLVQADYSSYSFSTTEYEAIYYADSTILMIEPLTLVAEDSTTTITIGGQLQMSQVHIPANEKIRFRQFEDLPLQQLDGLIMEFQEDQVFHFINIDNETAEKDTLSGSWTIEGDEVVTSLEHDDGSSEIEVMALEFDGDDLIITISESCTSERDVEGCLREKEEMYGFESGSLVSHSDLNVMHFQLADE